MTLEGKVQAYVNRDAKAIGSSMKIRLFPLVVEEAHGCRLKDVDGKHYLDLSASWAVNNTGYGHHKVVDTIKQQLDINAFTTYTTYINPPIVELGEKIISLMPGDFEKKVWFGLSGSDANDCISKLVPAATGRTRFISYFGAYHGQTMGSLGLSGHTAQAKFISGANITKVPYPYCYRCPFGKEKDHCGLFCLKFIEEQVFASVCPPEDVAAVIIEAVQCDGGVVPAPDDYLKELKNMCDRYGILLIVDEVKIGIGRTGKMFGIELYDVVPDAIVFGKPIASGMPLSGVVGRAEIADAGTASHLFTTAANPVSAVAGLATLEVVEEEKLIENAAVMGEYFMDQLNELKDKHELIGDVRGKGLVIGVELVKDRKTKEPAATEAAKASYRAFQKGLILPYVGIHSNVFEITPPLTITKEEIDEAIDIMDQTILDVMDGNVSDEDIADYAGW